MKDENIKNILKIIEMDFENKVFKLLDFMENPRNRIDPRYYCKFNAIYDNIKYDMKNF